MMPSNIIILQFSITFLLMMTFSSTTIIPQTTEMLSETSQSYHDEHKPTADIENYHHKLHGVPISSKHIAYANDDSPSEEEYDIDYLPIYHYEAFQHELNNKRETDEGTGGENRAWAIPYRFGKRAAMPYRFGKRAAMPYRFGKRAGMHFRLGKKSASL
ncbi:unnamed protein product [Adineta steineri]|uniref:Uncharacterized protein n=1 Tax=Adineta steineri TaxID=433720 RepID=A0A814VTG3_9BILA|nr:unnamed protein product [Adineta steineri]CAF1193261.1 unnamed protein product [Adineta steineri]CAF3786585.1 unnamed protein product [Adineta steineri]CAF3945969.1 unnamed protein product [Adineta steineri]